MLPGPLVAAGRSGEDAQRQQLPACRCLPTCTRPPRTSRADTWNQVSR
ncbi:hypothetical protein ACFQV2_20560 [Actinokineospora soli]|uniref:Uncharacterized protein n=1 Tax=Actinokineospora soli TaxID=1048753 RepID=A0ABW2TQ75_9PSEU